MTNSKLLLPLTVAASLAIGAASYHFGADYVRNLLQDNDVTKDVTKVVDENRTVGYDTQTPVATTSAPVLQNAKTPANVVQLVNQLDSITEDYFSREEQVDRVYNRTMMSLGSFSGDQLSTLEKEVSEKLSQPLSGEMRARKNYNNIVTSLDGFSQSALIGINKEIIRRLSPANYNATIRDECLPICKEKLDGGFGSTYSGN
jgi:hypothetical protein